MRIQDSGGVQQLGTETKNSVFATLCTTRRGLFSYLNRIIVEKNALDIKVTRVQHDLVHITCGGDHVQDDMACNVAFLKGNSPVQVQMSRLDFGNVGK